MGILTVMNRSLGNMWIEIKRLSVLANLLRWIANRKLKKCWEFLKSSNMRNTWAYLHLWEEGKSKLPLHKKKGFGVSFKVGKKSFYHKQGEKSWSKRWSKPSQLTPLVASSYHWDFAMILRNLSVIFGGANGEIDVKSTVLNGRKCAIQKLKGVWGSKTSLFLKVLSWLSKHGSCCITKTHYFTEYSSQNSSLIAWWWMLKIHKMALMNGGAF